MKLLRAVPVVLALGALASPAAAERPEVCIKWWPEVVAAMPGYNHIVVIQNLCEQHASCSVSTDVAPDPIPASLGGKQRTELVTFRGSPSRVFKAKVDCKMD
jgi:hypothetical protein